MSSSYLTSTALLPLQLLLLLSSTATSSTSAIVELLKERPLLVVRIQPPLTPPTATSTNYPVVLRVVLVDFCSTWTSSNLIALAVLAGSTECGSRVVVSSGIVVLE